MQYALLGNTGLVVSRMCFGAMTLREEGTSLGTVAKVRGKEADAMVGRAVDAGLNFFDTADMYSGGESELMLGNALKSRRNDVIIGTKCGLRTGVPLTHAAFRDGTSCGPWTRACGDSAPTGSTFTSSIARTR